MPLVGSLFIDFFNGIMVIPNVIALLALSGLVAKVLKDYDTKFMLGETPEYGALSPSGGEPFSLEPSPRKGRRFSRLKLRLRRKKTLPSISTKWISSRNAVSTGSKNFGLKHSDC
mgnify:CR=1 FL=1